MTVFIPILNTLVAIFHRHVMWLEMFAWATREPKTFKNLDSELFQRRKV